MFWRVGPHFLCKNYFQIQLCKYFMKDEMHSTQLLDLKDAQNVFWWESLNVNITGNVLNVMLLCWTFINANQKVKLELMMMFW